MRLKPLKRPSIKLRLLGLAASALIIAWGAGLISFANSLTRQPEQPLASTDAIVVLTGGSERLSTGLDLLRTGIAKKLFVSGVYRGVDVNALLRLSRQTPGDLECCIALGYAADDTEGNAVESARWMLAEGFTSLRLVTANYHLPRSLVEFNRAMPAIRIIPHPVTPTNVRLDDWWRHPGTAELIVNEYNKLLLAWVRGRMLGQPSPSVIAE